MKITKTHCDVCGVHPSHQIEYDYDRERDASGSMDTTYKTVDLCVEHLKYALNKFLVEPPLAPASCQKEALSKWAKQAKWSPPV